MTSLVASNPILWSDLTTKWPTQQHCLPLQLCFLRPPSSSPHPSLSPYPPFSSGFSFIRFCFCCSTGFFMSFFYQSFICVLFFLLVIFIALNDFCMIYINCHFQILYRKNCESIRTEKCKCFSSTFLFRQGTTSGSDMQTSLELVIGRSCRTWMLIYSISSFSKHKVILRISFLNHSQSSFPFVEQGAPVAVTSSQDSPIQKYLTPL